MMEGIGRRAFEVMGRLNFVRESGTPQEMEAVELICSEIRKSGMEPVVEEFQMEHSYIQKAELAYGDVRCEAGGYLLSGSTGEEGLTAPFLYAQNATEMDLVDAAGKILLLNQRLTPEVYRRVIASGAVGFLTFTGTIIDDRSITDLPDESLQPWAREIGIIPGLVIRAEDAMELVRANPETVTLTLRQEEKLVPAHNVVVDLPGNGKNDECIVLGGHYDTAQFSPGVYDNGAGSAILIELLEYFKEHPVRRPLRFVWFTAEERGLVGSKAYVKAHQDELEKIRFMVNVDLAAPLLGSDHACVMAEEGLVHMITYLGREKGFPIEAKQSIYSSDAIPFSDQKIPAVNFFRVGVNGGVKIHHRNDDLHQVGCENLARTTEFILAFLNRTLDAVVFPVPREVPQKITDDIDVYLKRKTE
ncbi:MAG TPA: hypothetical protein DCZ20_04435 [Lachnospiraceae bacterium]|nr:hypothetical protein [Lachnospiraceae bacterium]